MAYNQKFNNSSSFNNEFTVRNGIPDFVNTVIIDADFEEIVNDYQKKTKVGEKVDLNNFKEPSSKNAIKEKSFNTTEELTATTGKMLPEGDQSNKGAQVDLDSYRINKKELFVENSLNTEPELESGRHLNNEKERNVKAPTEETKAQPTYEDLQSKIETLSNELNELKQKSSVSKNAEAESSFGPRSERPKKEKASFIKFNESAEFKEKLIPKAIETIKKGKGAIEKKAIENLKKIVDAGKDLHGNYEVKIEKIDVMVESYKVIQKNNRFVEMKAGTTAVIEAGKEKIAQINSGTSSKEERLHKEKTLDEYDKSKNELKEKYNSFKETMKTLSKKEKKVFIENHKEAIKPLKESFLVASENKQKLYPNEVSEQLSKKDRKLVATTSLDVDELKRMKKVERIEKKVKFNNMKLNIASDFSKKIANYIEKHENIVNDKMEVKMEVALQTEEFKGQDPDKIKVDAATEVAKGNGNKNAITKALDASKEKAKAIKESIKATYQAGSSEVAQKREEAKVTLEASKKDLGLSK